MKLLLVLLIGQLRFVVAACFKVSSLVGGRLVVVKSCVFCELLLIELSLRLLIGLGLGLLIKLSLGLLCYISKLFVTKTHNVGA